MSLELPEDSRSFLARHAPEDVRRLLDALLAFVGVALPILEAGARERLERHAAAQRRYRERRKRARLLPAGFTMTAEMRGFVLEAAPALNGLQLFAAFCDDARGRRLTSNDWPAAFRRFVKRRRDLAVLDGNGTAPIRRAADRGIDAQGGRVRAMDGEREAG
jgi:hypothetical protein